MARQHVAARTEDKLYRALNSRLRARGFTPKIASFTGYGGEDFVRVLARVMLHSDVLEEATEPEGPEDQRGWRAFMGVPAIGIPVEIDLGHRVVDTTTDRSGYIDITVTDHRLAPGWHDLCISASGAPDASASVLIIGDDVTHALISDIDDTVMVTHMPRPLIAAWNAFVRTEQARDVVPGMAFMYRELLQDLGPGSPTFYLSTGAWNASPALHSFLRRHGYPDGPLLLTDWGPTNTGWFRSGWDHKITTLRRLASDFPRITWVLVGDDGQHDPAIYSEFVHSHPESVEVIAIRQLSVTQQVLSHGLPISNDELLGKTHQHSTPMVTAPDGFRLLRRTQRVRELAASGELDGIMHPGAGQG